MLVQSTLVARKETKVGRTPMTRKVCFFKINYVVKAYKESFGEIYRWKRELPARQRDDFFGRVKLTIREGVLGSK
jgi:hypothetical protein